MNYIDGISREPNEKVIEKDKYIKETYHHTGGIWTEDGALKRNLRDLKESAA